MPGILLESNKLVVTQIWDELVNRSCFDRVTELVAPDFVDHTPLPGQPADFEGLKQRLQILHSAFPDFHSVIDDLIADHDKVVARITSTGSHRRPFLGVPPTGRRWTIMEIHILRITDGRMSEHWGMPDFFDMLVQLGLVSAPWQT